MDTGLLPQGLNNVTLPNPTPTYQDQIGSTPNEVSGSQLFDLPAVQGLGVELPIEAFSAGSSTQTFFPTPSPISQSSVKSWSGWVPI
jgi:hypothetical protein